MRASTLMVVALTAGCTAWNPAPLPLAPSPAAVSGAGHGLRAGFGRADITPPPGVGLAGNGPEGLTSTGWRHRVLARALVLEDARGERIALVTVDLAHVSANLHRLAAERIVSATGIGADRLIVSATHSHSGPAHFYAERAYNKAVARRAGYDPAVVELLVDGIARAVRTAVLELAPARAAWGVQRVKGLTRNRSYSAYCRNDPHQRSPCPGEPGGEGSDSLTRSVDTLWTMLRVDRANGPNGSYQPAGAFSVFAIHGTGNPSATTLIDGDIHAVIERRLERAIDSVNSVEPGFTPRAVHVFANGAEGDVSPAWPAESRCPTPKLRPEPGAGPRGMEQPWDWRPADSAVLRRCLHLARRFIADTGRILGDSAVAHFVRLGASLRSDLTISRSFITLALPSHDGLCPSAVAGTSVAGGAEDARTRVAGWKLFGLIPLGFEEGGAAIRDPPKGCQGAKQPLFGPFQQALIGKHGFPDAVDLSVVRIGDLLLGTAPAEPTTAVGRRWEAALRAGADPTGTRGLRAAIIGLTNGFLFYVATPAEYARQTYEGGSTLYGPRTSEVFAAELERLARSAMSDHPTAEVGPLTANSGKSSRILATATAGPRLEGPPVLLGSRCQGDTLVIRWLDEPPGRLRPADGQVLALEVEQNGRWRTIATDDDEDVVVQANRPRPGKGFEWTAIVSRPTPIAIRFRLVGRGTSGDRLTTTPLPGCPR